MDDPRKNYSGKTPNKLIESEVDSIMKTGKDYVSSRDILKMKNKRIDDETIDKIKDKFIEEHQKLRKEAKKFAAVIWKKYGNQNYPLHKLLRKAYKYKKKYKMSDEKFDVFKRIYQRYLTGSTDKLKIGPSYVPATKLGKTLGSLSYDTIDKMRVQEKEMGDLKMILTAYKNSRPIHSQIIVQSMAYRDLALEALTGQFDPKKHNPNCHVHPLIAAMFLPKIEIFNQHMLYANIAYIVKARHKGEKIMTKPDYQLYYDLISDPNDIVCDKDSPIRDLKNRVELQLSLWESVLSLRNGRYYDCNNTKFLMAIDNCKINTYDTPDLMYVGDVGTVLRRLLHAFSLRPTIVASTPLYSVSSVTPYSTAIHAPKVTSLPMVTLRLPYNLSDDEDHVDLKDSLQQPQWFLENGKVLPKTQNIIYSKGVLIFYVNRRISSINVGRLNEPYNFNRLPVSIASVERANSKIVNFNSVMDIRKDLYHLKSVVCVETNPNVNDIIIGNSCMLVKSRNLKDSLDNISYSPKHYWYNPSHAAIIHRNGDPNPNGLVWGMSGDGNNLNRQTPITWVDHSAGLHSDKEVGFYEKCSKYGSIFIYESENIEATKSEIRTDYRPNYRNY